MRTRTFFRLMSFGLIALIIISVVAAFAAALTINVSTIGQVSITASANDLKPSACTMNLTNIVRGEGTEFIGDSSNDLILGSSGDDIIDGRGGDDCILGDDGNDNIIGGDGNDHILGGDGDDTITGGDGNDHIIGGDGNDTCTGGLGTNSFESCETVNDP